MLNAGAGAGAGVGVHVDVAVSQTYTGLGAVHVVGLQDGEFPMKRGDVDEEVRVLYVALTRARRYLGWTRAPGQRPSRLLPPPTFSAGPKKRGLTQ